MSTFYELKSLKMQATTQYFGKLVPVQAGDPRGAAKRVRNSDAYLLWSRANSTV